MTRYFVTGTDTGVGKTAVAAGLLTVAAGRGRARGIKAVETGCEPGADGELVAADAEALGAAAGHRALCPFRFRPPVAPSVAAGANGVALDAIATFVDQHPAEFVLVEGAGGLLVPLGPRHDMADLATALGAACLVVAADRLGTINHTLLTLAAARGRGLRIAGVVLNDCDGNRDSLQENHRELAERASCPVVTLRHRPEREDFVGICKALELGGPGETS